MGPCGKVSLPRTDPAVKPGPLTGMFAPASKKLSGVRRIFPADGIVQSEYRTRPECRRGVRQVPFRGRVAGELAANDVGGAAGREAPARHIQLAHRKCPKCNGAGRSRSGDNRRPAFVINRRCGQGASRIETQRQDAEGPRRGVEFRQSALPRRRWKLRREGERDMPLRGNGRGVGCVTCPPVVRKLTVIVSGALLAFTRAIDATLSSVLSKGTRIRVAAAIAGDVPTCAGSPAGLFVKIA